MINLEMPKDFNNEFCMYSPKDITVFNMLEDYSDSGYIFCAEETRN